MARYPYSILLFLVCFTALQGCKSASETASNTEMSPQPVDRQKSLQHYIEGSLFDQKGEYAKAILEYQDALRYDNDPAIYYALSRDYRNIGKYALAAQMGQEAVKLAPMNRSYRQNLAEVYAGSFEIDKAITQYEETLRLDSTSAEDWYSLARLYQMKKPLKALEVYRQIIDRFGPNWEVYSQMAGLYAVLSRYMEVAGILSEMLSLDPGNYELEKSRADAFLQAGTIDSALQIYTSLIERNPDDVEVRAAIANAYLSMHDYQRATQQLVAILSADTLSVDVQLRFGQNFASYLQKDSSSAPFAYEIFQNIRRNYPNDWRPYWFLGVIANIMRHDSDAVSNFERVTELAPTNPDGWVYLASLYLDRNEFEKTTEILQKAENLVRNESRIHLLLGVAYQRLNRHEDAISALEQALQIDPKSISALTSLALSFEELKRHSDADSLYEEALRLDPNNHLLLNNYGYSLADRGEQLERALEMAKEALGQQPENSSYLDTIGWVYFKLGQYDEAVRFITKAVEKGDASPVVLEHLGDANAKLGERGKAVQYWKQAFERDPSNVELKNKIERGNL